MSNHKVVHVTIPPTLEAPPNAEVILFMKRKDSGAELIGWVNCATEAMKDLETGLNNRTTEPSMATE